LYSSSNTISIIKLRIRAEYVSTQKLETILIMVRKPQEKIIFGETSM
jgi:hypothetical protein